jgi:type IV pilus biogenesis protein CpaD/CtpE
MSKKAFYVVLSAVLAGCAVIPEGPRVTVMPAPGKPFEVFEADNATCMAFAQQQSGVTPSEAAQQQVLTGAVVGTALGAATGALLGGNANSAAAGAGVGLLAGTATGAGNANWAGMSLQQRYDIAYEQCMYAKGNQVPGFASLGYLPPPPPPPRPYP